MKKINNNLIALFAVSVFILTFSFASPVQAFMVGSGATITSITPNGSTNPTPPVSPNPSPVIYSISPNSVNAGSESITVTITGAGFVPNSLAEKNNSYRSTGYTDSNNLTMTLNASDLATPGSYLITVSNPAPGGGTSNVEYLTVKTFSKSSNLGLSANAFSSGFMPTNLLQWLLLLIVILLLIIIVRKLMNKNKKATLTVLNVSTNSVTLNATGLTPNVTHVFEITGAMGSSSKVQVTPGKDGTANVSFANLNPNSHYTATVSKHNPTNGLLTNVGIPALHFDTLKQA